MTMQNFLHQTLNKSKMNIITCLEKSLDALTLAAECMTSEHLQDEEVAALVAEIQSTLDAMLLD